MSKEDFCILKFLIFFCQKNWEFIYIYIADGLPANALKILTFMDVFLQYGQYNLGPFFKVFNVFFKVLSLRPFLMICVKVLSSKKEKKLSNKKTTSTTNQVVQTIHYSVYYLNQLNLYRK